MSLKAQLKARGVEVLVRQQPRLSRVVWAARGRWSAQRVPRDAIELFFDPGDVYSWLLAVVLSRSRLPRELILHLVDPPTPEFDPQPELRRSHALRDAEELIELYQLGDLKPGSLEPHPDRSARAASALAGLADVGARLGLIADSFDWVWGRAPESQHEQLATVSPRGSERLSAALADGNRRRRFLGHYQGGMLACEGQWYWGLDRLPLLISELTGRALEECRGEIFIERELTAPGLARASALELYFSFRSPYAYLGLQRTADLARRQGLPLRVAPVLPMVMRGLAVPRQKQLYILFDAAREARHLGVPFGRICDPVGSGAERCMAGFVVAEEQGRGLEFCLRAASGIWSEGLEVAGDAGLRRVCDDVSVDWTRVQSQIASGGWRRMAEQNRQRLTDLGLWGVPCVDAGSHRVWGQDRLAMLERRLSATLGAAAQR